MKKLFVVATPIGNRGDITFRALDVLFASELILSENPQKTKSLLLHYLEKFPALIQSQSIPKIITYNEYEESIRGESFISHFDSHDTIALVSEAGTPLLSDPGYKIVHQAHNQNIQVVPVPGVSAISAALSTGLMPTDSFYFLGFLPKKQSQGKKMLIKLKESKLKTTIVQYESVHRIAKTLDLIREVFGEIDIGIVREVTKIHEEIQTLPISDAVEKYSTKSKGEFVLLYRI